MALDELLAPGRALRPVRPGIVSALPTGEQAASYDRRAAAYDRLVRSRAYNRVAWGTSPDAYAAFAAEAVGAGDGPLLDVGCGTAAATGEAYRAATRPLLLVDRSLEMLERAAGRLEGGPAAFLQADLLDLPFAPRRFATVACFGVLHVLDDPRAALAALAEQVAPGGRLFASMLVADRLVGRAYLAALRQAGEVGPARRAAELEAAARDALGPGAQVRRTGSMAWLRAQVAT